jgi:predicted nucleic acid-binding protein
VLVVDASVLAPVVADGGADGRRFRQRLHGEAVFGPDLLRIEVASVLRRHANTGHLTAAEADGAMADLLDLPVGIVPTTPLLGRAWELRANLTIYDACYVALAESAGCPLLTADRRLANAPGPRCPIEVL